MSLRLGQGAALAHQSKAPNNADLQCAADVHACGDVPLQQSPPSLSCLIVSQMGTGHNMQTCRAAPGQTCMRTVAASAANSPHASLPTHKHTHLQAAPLSLLLA